MIRLMLFNVYEALDAILTWGLFALLGWLIGSLWIS